MLALLLVAVFLAAGAFFVVVLAFVFVAVFFAGAFLVAAALVAVFFAAGALVVVVAFAAGFSAALPGAASFTGPEVPVGDGSVSKMVTIRRGTGQIVLDS